MAVASDRSEMNLSFDENVIGINVSDDFVKLITNEIVEILQLHDDEMGGQIVEDLLENGRRSLVKYKDDIILKRYNEAMNGNDTELMNSIKKYFRQKWEIQYGSSNPWFISFLKQYENGENHDMYENILIRAAQYGNKYMKDCPLLSIVLQLLFECIDDDCLQETNNIFDDLWVAVTNDGLKSITKYSNYIVKKVLNEQLEKQSVLYEALHDYYRSNVFLSLTQSNIANRQNLYHLASDDVVEHGWLSDMKSIEGDIAPRRYQMLLENLRSFYKKQKLAHNEDPNGLVVPPPKVNLSPSSEHDATNNGQQALIEVNQSKGNQLQSTVSMQNVTSTDEMPPDTTIVTEALDHVSDENVEKTDSQKDKNERDGDESDDSHDSKSDPSSTDNMLACSKDAIFINGLPATMPKGRLYDKIRDVFKTCGDIKIYDETNKSDIWLFPRRENKLLLNGTAMVRFEKEESAMTAIGKYNGQQVPAFNNARISVRFFEMKPKGVDKSSRSRPKAQEYLAKGQSTIHTKGTQSPKRDESVSSNSSRSSAGGRILTDNLNTPIFHKDTIYITGLPKNMPGQRLFDTLWDEFFDVGPIKINKKTSKPYIKLYVIGPQARFNGAATVTFERDESVTKAITKYNGTQVSSLNNSRLFVQRSRRKTAKSTQLSESQSLARNSRPDDQPDAPVSIFWDIENVPIPTRNNAFDILMKLRKRLIEDRKLVEGTFKTYYRNINNIPQQHRADLHHANVLVQHIESNKIGAVDRQIQKDLQQFMDQHKTPATVVLISGDIDFIKDLNELRFRHRHYIVIIHNPQAKYQLLKTANEFIPWEDFVEKEYSNGPLQQFTARNPRNLLKEVTQTQMSSILKPKDNLGRTSSPRHNLDKTRPSTPPSKCSPLMELNINKSTVNTDDALELTSPVADQPEREKHHNNENKSDVQPLELLMSLTSGSPNATAVGSNSVVSSTNKTKKPKKNNLSSKTVGTISCSICDRTFPIKAALLQHEQDKHKVGTLIEISSSAPTAASDDHSQPFGYEKQTSINLIAFDDDDNSHSSQPNLLTTVTEISHSVVVSDDDSNISESSSDLNDNVWLETTSPDNEKPTEIDVAKQTEEDD